LYYKVIVTPIVAYGASVWGHRLTQNQTLATKIDVVQRKIMLRMTGPYKTAPNNSLAIILGVPPLHLEVIKRGMHYWLKKGKLLNLTNYTQTPITTLIELNDWILNNWQHKWNISTKGRRLYQLLPSVQERIALTYLQPTRGMMHFLTGHGPYKEKLTELRLINNNMCECGEEVGTPEHTTFQCSLTEQLVSEERRMLDGLTPEEIIRDKSQFEILNLLTDKISKFYIQRYNNPI
jgi:hypothetical protein